MYNVGSSLQATYAHFAHVTTLRWTGPQQQAATTTAARDLSVANIPVSVKAGSHVVANLSPFNLIQNVPRGLAPASNEENWYLVRDPAGFQALYTYVRSSDPRLAYLSPSVSRFENDASEADRDLVQSVITSYDATRRSQFMAAYVPLCHTVATNSAAIFYQNIQASLAGTSRTSVLEYIAKWFFRMNATSYVLCGIDARRGFAVRVPDLTEWSRHWRIQAIAASPDLSRRQSVVLIDLTVEDRSSGNRLPLRFHAELRWSHGKFCGNPEAKFYKHFFWRDLPFFEILV